MTQGFKPYANRFQGDGTELPPELKAMNEAMNMVFEAVKPKGVHVTEHRNSQGNLPSERRFDIEQAIMRAPDFDYLLASEIFAALHKRLELRYENNLNTELEARLKKLSEAFDHVCG